MNLAYFHILSSNDLSHKMEFFEHIFRPLMRSGFLRLSSDTVIVAIQFNAILNATNYTKLTNELFDLNSFLCFISRCNILNLCCRIRDGTLFRAQLTTLSLRQKMKSELRSKIIFVTLEACIGVSSNNQVIISPINQKIVLSSS